LIPYLTAAWLLGVACLSLRLITSFVAVRRLATRHTSPLPGDVLETAQQLARVMGVGRAIRFLESAVITTPTVIGHLAPIVLLPASAITGLTPEQLRAVLAHELAHIRRHDYLINLAQCLIETLLFYHPAAWVASNRIRLERELCCDDAALANGAESGVYAKALLLIAEAATRAPQTSAASQLAPAATGSDLTLRVKRILNLPADNPPATLTSHSLPSAILAASLLIGVALTTIGFAAQDDTAILNDAAIAQARQQIIARHRALLGQFDIHYRQTNHYRHGLAADVVESMRLQGSYPHLGHVDYQNRFASRGDLKRIDFLLTAEDKDRQRELHSQQKTIEHRDSTWYIRGPEREELLRRSLMSGAYDMATHSLKPPASDPAEQEASLRVHKNLKKKIPVSFSNDAFSSVLTYIRKYIGVNIVVNWNALEELGVTKGSLVTLASEKLSASDALEKVLASLNENLRYEVKDGVVIFTTAQALMQPQDQTPSKIQYLLDARRTFIDIGLGLRRIDQHDWLSANFWEAIEFNAQEDGLITGRLKLEKGLAEQWTWDPEHDHTLVRVERYKDDKIFHRIEAEQFQIIGGHTLPMRLTNTMWTFSTNTSPFNSVIQVDEYRLNDPENNNALYQIDWPEELDLNNMIGPQKFPAPPAPSPPVPSDFEDAIEITIPQDGANAHVLIDFDHGKIVPASESPEGDMSWADWRRLNGVDAEVSHADQTITFYGVRLTGAGANPTSLTAEQIRLQLKSLQSQRENTLPLKPMNTQPYLIDTREGGQGTLQFTQRFDSDGRAQNIMRYQLLKNPSHRIVYVADPAGRKRSSRTTLFRTNSPPNGFRSLYMMDANLVENSSVPVKFGGDDEHTMFELGINEADHWHASVWVSQPGGGHQEFELDRGQSARFTHYGRVFSVSYSESTTAKSNPGIWHNVGVWLMYHSSMPDTATVSKSTDVPPHWLIGEWIQGEADRRHVVYFPNNRYRLYLAAGPAIEEGEWRIKNTTLPVNDDNKVNGKPSSGVIEIPYIEHRADGADETTDYYLSEQLTATGIDAFYFVDRGGDAIPMQRRGVNKRAEPRAIPFDVKSLDESNDPAPEESAHKKAGREWDQLPG
jgi:beta-lactamase regulating signal transducer with metallopeptidase domain